MLSLELQPCERLRPYVHLIWCLEFDDGAEFGPPERIAPDGVVELVFHYRVPMAMRFAGEGPTVQPRSSAVTLTRRFVEIAPSGPTGFLSVRFKPWGAYRFLKPPVSELADRLVPAGDLWGRAIAEVEERLAEAASTECRVAVVEGFLLERLRGSGQDRVEPLVRSIQRRRGDLRVADLCAEFGLGERTVERVFADSVGLPPRSFIRLTRFLHACSRLRGGDETRLGEMALDCGYYDQAHFIADVKAFSGLTPRELAAAPVFSFLEPD